MTTLTRRWLFGCLVLMLVAAPAGLLTLAELNWIPAQTSTSTHVAGAWFNQLTPAELATAQRGIAQLPAARQMFVVRTLSPEGQSQFWRSHLQSYLDRNTNLRQEAVAAIRATIEVLSPEHYADPRRFEFSKQLVHDKLSSVVDGATYDYLLYLGERLPSKGIVARTVMSRSMTWLRSKVVAGAQPLPCDCVQESGGTGCGVSSLRCEYPTVCNPGGGIVCQYGGNGGSGACYGKCGTVTDDLP